MIDFYVYLVISELKKFKEVPKFLKEPVNCLLYTSPSPRDRQKSHEA